MRPEHEFHGNWKLGIGDLEKRESVIGENKELAIRKKRKQELVGQWKRETGWKENIEWEEG